MVIAAVGNSENGKRKTSDDLCVAKQQKVDFPKKPLIFPSIDLQFSSYAIESQYRK